MVFIRLSWFGVGYESSATIRVGIGSSGLVPRLVRPILGRVRGGIPQGLMIGLSRRRNGYAASGAASFRRSMILVASALVMSRREASFLPMMDSM